jgi:hypothetical protein
MKHPRSTSPVAIEPKLGKCPLRQILGVFHIANQPVSELNQRTLMQRHQPAKACSVSIVSLMQLVSMQLAVFIVSGK